MAAGYGLRYSARSEANRRGAETELSIITVKQHQDFDLVYDLDEPRSYFRALAPLDYRGPTVMAEFILAHGAALRRARGKERLRLLDFACGYGAIGMLLRYQISLSDIFSYYDSPPASDPVLQDKSFFRKHQSRDAMIEIGGLDIAARALAYAKGVGALDQAYCENLMENPPSPSLADFLSGTDLVLEAGAIGTILADVFGCLLEQFHDRPENRPWFLLTPRPDVDDGPLRRLFDAQGYVLESLLPQPYHYRRLMSEQEIEDAAARMTALGKATDRLVSTGAYFNPLLLARPECDLERPPVEALSPS